MSGPRPSSPDLGTSLLQRCIRDLVGLSALPSMCLGRSPSESLRIVLEALPTALSCDLVYVALPASPPRERATLDGVELNDAQLAELRAALAAPGDDGASLLLGNAGRLWFFDVDLPIGGETGRLLAGRRSPLSQETDRVLVRTAANLVGTTLESANVLEVAQGKDEFLAMLGHELRNPLAPMVTAIELLRRHPVAAREQQVLERQTRHLSRLVDDLLDVSRVTRGHIELRREEVKLGTVLERAVELAESVILRQEHTLRVVNEADITLKGDPVRLAQVFGNLLTNAAKFTPPRGTIEARVERLPGRVRVTVSDNGRGIEREQLDRIFEPFVQVDRTKDSRHGGLGLGLAIVNNLVGLHGGSITARSAGLGLGSSFAVELPTVKPLEAAVTVAAAAPDPTRRAGVRILVVDDNEDIAELLSTALELEGFETAVEHDANAALQTWRRFAPHAAVLDVGLPQLDGYELAKLLRAEHGGRPTLIAATGYGQAKDRDLASAAGFDCHFVKPVSIDQLLRELDQRVVSAGER